MKIFKKKNKIYEYHICYHNKLGLGSCAIGFKKKITSIDNLKEIKEHIEKEYEAENVGIINYQLIGIKKIKEDK